MNILLDAWATTMWQACWQGGLVVLVVWSICRLIPSMPARFQCWLWRLANSLSLSNGMIRLATEPCWCQSWANSVPLGYFPGCPWKRWDRWKL